MFYKFIETYDLREVLLNTGLRQYVHIYGKYVVSDYISKLKIKIAHTVKNNIELVTRRHVISRVLDYRTKEEILLIHVASPYTKCKNFKGSRGERLLLDMLKPEVKTFSEWLKSCAR
jgi:hypothetical protein